MFLMTLTLVANGGPGCSGLIGLLTEHGPCRIQEDGSVVKNEQAWINTANMIYVEQPIGTGYSFDSSNASTPSTTWMAARDIVIFLNLWYSHFPEYKKNDLHLSGESYAGHYLPMFAKEIRNYNDAMHVEDRIPLESIIIGNGQYDLTIQEMSIYNMTCTSANGLGYSVLNATECAQMESIIPECHKLYRDCSKTLDNQECEPAFKTCFPQTELKFLDSNRDIYDIRVHCEPGTACDPYSQLDTDFWNNPKVQAAFGASDPAWKQWEECNDDIYMAFLNANDGWDASAPVLRDLLDQNFRVLLYTGVYDVICNYVGAEEVLGSLDWHGLDAFNKGSAAPITWSGGKYWDAKNLRYSRVNNAGHVRIFHDFFKDLLLTVLVCS